MKKDLMNMDRLPTLEELLFVKAYALGAMEARELKEEWQHPKGWMSADSSSFEKEMELFLFDM